MHCNHSRLQKLAASDAPRETKRGVENILQLGGFLQGPKHKPGEESNARRISAEEFPHPRSPPALVENASENVATVRFARILRAFADHDHSSVLTASMEPAVHARIMEDVHSLLVLGSPIPERISEQLRVNYDECHRAAVVLHPLLLLLLA
eukprot:CAMPEP_0171656524 /NCGR_PEP_ID=MMETSP0990-20121206/41634_1 /TAXON_ID=483369 /ORGANISM="non described non described, Strain CCMP2098" /LENGTH=150 /DNA_ID=CAMNT_0012237017 /DNA_START=309 /DNA_END=763 /DNA_ORIENTATION=+